MSFKRRYKLTIGIPEKRTPALLIEKLHIDFNINKSDKANDTSSGTATIRIYNLAQDSLKKIVKDHAVVLQVGYLDDVGDPIEIFTGDILSVTSRKQGSNLETILECGTGYSPRRESFTSKSFLKGTTVQQVLEHIATVDLKVATNSANFNNGDLGDDKGLKKIFRQGTSYSGTSIGIIKKLCKDNELIWVIRRGSFYVFPVNGSLSDVIQTKVLSPANGLMDTPERLITKSTKLKASKDLKDGFRVRMLINGFINIGDLVSVVSTTIHPNAVFRVSKMTIKGQFQGDKWEMILELLQLEIPEKSEEAE